jgi:methionine sulfoxide reductase heme-binding subunit
MPSAPTTQLRVPSPRPSRPAEAGAGIVPRARARHARITVWLFRALLLVPFILMAPEVAATMQGQPDGIAHLSSSDADVLGTSTFIIFALMLSVTPVATMTGWRWHIVLRRDYGIAMFLAAATDITLAAISTGDTFSGGVPGRLGGHSFLLAGSVSTALLVPLALTANRRAQRWLGTHWRTVQRLTYVVWFTVLIHLLLLFGFRSFALDALLVSLPLLTLRLPALKRWWVTARHDGRRRGTRACLALVLVSIFAAGFVPFVHELAVKGSAAFMQQPVDD